MASQRKKAKRKNDAENHVDFARERDPRKSKKHEKRKETRAQNAREQVKDRRFENHHTPHHHTSKARREDVMGVVSSVVNPLLPQN